MSTLSDSEPVKITDKMRLDFLEVLLKKRDGRCRLDFSRKGTGFKLHESRATPSRSTVRGAIDEVLHTVMEGAHDG